MRNILALAPLCALVACNPTSGDQAAARQAKATHQATNNADRAVGMPRISNFAQRKLLKNAYEDMDQTTLTYVYTQALDGKFVCLGQALGYGVSLGTQFTPPEYPTYVYGDSSAQTPTSGTYMLALPEPNGLYMPSAGDATIVDLIDPKTGQAHTAMVEPHVMTIPFELPAASVDVQCPDDVDPSKVVDAKETSIAAMAK